MITVPYRLTWKDGELATGRGRAGWTVATFETKEEANAFMASHPEAAMPCWEREKERS